MQRMLFVCVQCRHMKVSPVRLVLGLMMACTLHGVMTGARLPSLDRTALCKYSVSNSYTAGQGSWCMSLLFVWRGTVFQWGHGPVQCCKVVVEALAWCILYGAVCAESSRWTRRKCDLVDLWTQIKLIAVVCPALRPLNNIWAMLIIQRIRGKIIRTVLCCIVYDSCAHWYAMIWYEQFLKLTVGLGLVF